MQTASQIRRTRLAQLITQFGKAADLARHADKDPRQVSAWATGTKKISDATARELEAACGKPVGWMDSESDSRSPSLHAENPTQSQLPRTDRSKMRDAMALLKHLGDLTGVPSLATDPDAIAIAFDFLVEFDTPLDESNVLDLTKRLAAKLRGELNGEPERSKTA
jgi:hypothetical protein